MIAYRTSLVTLVALGLTAVVGSPVQAMDGPSCGKFQYYWEFTENKHIDQGQPGVDVGDTFVGYGRIFDKDNNDAGSFYFHEVASPHAGQGALLLSQGFDVFPNGTLSWTGMRQVPPTTREIAYPITGGTGAFIGASGTSTASVDEQGRFLLDFDITCR